MKKIYIAGKISGECETQELMKKCKEKFYSYSNNVIGVEKSYGNSIMFYTGFGDKCDTWYTNGLFINREILGEGTWIEYMKNDLTILLRCN